LTDGSAPLIGIPCRHDVSATYAQRQLTAQSDTYLTAISRAGGIPFLIPLTPIFLHKDFNRQSDRSPGFWVCASSQTR